MLHTLIAPVGASKNTKLNCIVQRVVKPHYFRVPNENCCVEWAEAQMNLSQLNLIWTLNMAQHRAFSTVHRASCTHTHTYIGHAGFAIQNA